MLEEIENYIYSINIQMLSMEELEHLTKILIALETKKLNDLERERMKEKQD
jgi:hypothetical protein